MGPLCGLQSHENRPWFLPNINAQYRSSSPMTSLRNVILECDIVQRKERMNESNKEVPVKIQTKD
jgi:hypothetical protein